MPSFRALPPSACSRHKQLQRQQACRGALCGAGTRSSWRQQQQRQHHFHLVHHQAPVSRAAQVATVCSSCASGALPTAMCRTVVRVASPDDLQLVLMGNDLVAEVFYSRSDNPVVDAMQFNSYRLRSAAQTLSLHMGPTRTHATVVALPAGDARGLLAQQQQQHAPRQRHHHQHNHDQPHHNQQQQQHQQRQQQAPRQALGVVNVSLMQATPSVATAASCRPGTPYAMITNMAVSPGARRRGVAHALMQAAIKASMVDLDAAPPFALLLAYKFYEPAMRLYEAWGFEATPWVDPAWQEDTERGRMQRQRRVMMIKQLSGSGLGAAVRGRVL